MRHRVLAFFPLILACASPSASAPAPCSPCVTPGQPVASGTASARPERSAKLDELADRRVALAHERVEELRLAYQHGAARLGEVLIAYRDIAVAARESGLAGEKLRRELTVYRDATIELEKDFELRSQAGNAGPEDVVAARLARSEAEYWLVEASERP